MRLIQLLCLTLSMLSGCAIDRWDSTGTDTGATVGQKKSQNTPDRGDNTEALLQARLASRSLEVGRLRLQLLAKQAEINQLLISHERALQETMRANARLRGLDSKADAVANIAEATLTIRNAKELAQDEQQQALIHADKLLEVSRKELQAGNPDAASYLAGKALSLAQPPRPATDYGPDNQAEKSETEFAVPLSMMVKRQSNVREKPRIDSSPRFQLAGGSRVKALGYRDLWIRVLAEEDREGWIYYNLLETVDPGASGQ